MSVDRRYVYIRKQMLLPGGLVRLVRHSLLPIIILFKFYKISNYYINTVSK